MDGKEPKYGMPRLQLQIVGAAEPDMYWKEVPFEQKRDRNCGRKKPPVKRMPWMWFPPSNASKSYKLGIMVDEMLYSQNNKEVQ